MVSYHIPYYLLSDKEMFVRFNIRLCSFYIQHSITAKLSEDPLYTQYYKNQKRYIGKKLLAFQTSTKKLRIEISSWWCQTESNVESKKLCTFWETYLDDYILRIEICKRFYWSQKRSKFSSKRLSSNLIEKWYFKSLFHGDGFKFWEVKLFKQSLQH